VAALYGRHDSALAATYADIENHALNQDAILVGTPGAISLRENGTGTRYYVRQFYDFGGTKRDQYLVQAEAPSAAEILGQWRRRLDEAKALRDSVRLLSREGYATLDRKPFAALATVAAHGLFGAGGMLLGTHAFGVILNRLGIRASVFATEDLDIARASRLKLPGVVPEGGLLAILRESGIDFVGVPRWEHGAPSAKFKERGRSRFSFALLVPSSAEEAHVVEVPELRTHATALPYLRYLVSDSQPGAVLSSHGVLAVRVPLPERFAIHKLLVSQLRAGVPEKSRKDRSQAAVLIAALGELQPGALEAGFAKTPVSRRRDIRKALELIRGDLEPHPQAWTEIASAAKVA
jgi:hypothetical protein